MSYLLDTNVLPELVRAKPNPADVAWFESVPDDRLYVSVLTFGEIRKGVESLVSNTRREKLRVWFEHTLPDWFEDHLLAIDHGVAERWGRHRTAPRPAHGHPQHPGLRLSRP
ncbi:MAG: PIN domain-containing protein [Mariprofundaceae bacterium]